MYEYELAIELPCDETTYWERVFFDDDYNRGFWNEALGFPVWSARVEAIGFGLRRSVEVQPRIASLPKWLAALVSSNFAYREEGVFDRAQRRYEYRCTSPILGDKASMGGAISARPLRPGVVRRIHTQFVDAGPLRPRHLIETSTARSLSSTLALGTSFEVSFAAAAQARAVEARSVHLG